MIGLGGIAEGGETRLHRTWLGAIERVFMDTEKKEERRDRLRNRVEDRDEKKQRVCEFPDKGDRVEK